MVAIPADIEYDDDDEDEENEARTGKLLDDLTSMLRPVHDVDGNLVGRMALVPRSWRHYWSDFGVVTVGGFRSAEMAGAAGILTGSSTRASRDSAVLTISLEQFHLWLREQEALVRAHTQDPEALLECAATVRGCGLIPEILPIAEGSDGLKTAAQIRSWTPIPDELILVQDASLALQRRQLDDIELHPNVLAVNAGFRAFVSAARGGPGLEWPEGLSQFHEFTLEGAVAQLIAEMWNLPPKHFMESLDKDSKKVAIGTAHGELVRTRAVILRRPTPKLA
jgi:hypothetical protein